MYGKSPQIFALEFRVAADFHTRTNTSPQIFLNVANAFLHALKYIYWHRAVLVLDLEASRRPSTLATIPNQRLRKKPENWGWAGAGRKGGPRSLNVFQVQ